MKRISTLIIMALIATPVFAQEPMVTDVTQSDDFATMEKTYNPKTKFPRGMQLGLGVSGTSGLNGFVGYANKDFESFWWKRLGIRLDFATTSPVKSMVNSALDNVLSDGVDLGDGMTINSGTLSANHFGAIVDFYPFGNTWFAGGWRISGGYMTGKMNMVANLSGQVSGAPSDPFEFELNGTEYKYAGNSVTGQADLNWNYSGPYLGTGFDLGLFWGIKIYMDAGVVFTSKTAAVGLDVPLDGLEYYVDGTGWVPVDGSGYETQFEADKASALAKANDELSDLKWYPLIKLGFMYRF